VGVPTLTVRLTTAGAAFSTASAMECRERHPLWMSLSLYLSLCLSLCGLGLSLYLSLNASSLPSPGASHALSDTGGAPTAAARAAEANAAAATAADANAGVLAPALPGPLASEGTPQAAHIPLWGMLTPGCSGGRRVGPTGPCQPVLTWHGGLEGHGSCVLLRGRVEEQNDRGASWLRCPRGHASCEVSSLGARHKAEKEVLQG